MHTQETTNEPEIFTNMLKRDTPEFLVVLIRDGSGSPRSLPSAEAYHRHKHEHWELEISGDAPAIAVDLGENRLRSNLFGIGPGGAIFRLSKSDPPNSGSYSTLIYTRLPQGAYTLAIHRKTAYVDIHILILRSPEDMRLAWSKDSEEMDRRYAKEKRRLDKEGIPGQTVYRVVEQFDASLSDAEIYKQLVDRLRHLYETAKEFYCPVPSDGPEATSETGLAGERV